MNLNGVKKGHSFKVNPKPCKEQPNEEANDSLDIGYVDESENSVVRKLNLREFNMNKKQKKVAVVAIIFIFFTLLFHPYNLLIPESDGKKLYHNGYKFIWQSGPFQEFDYFKLLIEWVAILIIAALAYKIYESNNE